MDVLTPANEMVAWQGVGSAMREHFDNPTEHSEEAAGGFFETLERILASRPDD